MFPNRAGFAPMSRRRHGRACARFAEAWGWEPFGPHDLRRTIATRLAKLGVVKEINQRLLGHKVGSGEAILHYDHHDYAEQKRVALELWEGELNVILSLTPNHAETNKVKTMPYLNQSQKKSFDLNNGL